VKVIVDKNYDQTHTETIFFQGGFDMKRLLLLVVLVLTAGLLFAGGGREAPRTEEGRKIVEIWFHSGKGPERVAINEQIDTFNTIQDDILVFAKMIPEGGYNDAVQAGALAGDLPDLLDFDGPFVYNYAWAGYLQPMDDFVPQSLIDDVLPSIIDQGTYQGQLWSLGTFDSGLGLYANRAYLREAGIRIPQGVNDAWTRQEFDEALVALQALPQVEYPLDLKMNYDGEWYTYAFSPILQSFGADLIDRSDYQSADGVLNGRRAVEAMTMFQSWFDDGFTRFNPGGDTDMADGRAALSYVGHWMYNDLKAALGDDLVLLPMPRFGGQSVTGMGSWNWGLTADAQHPEAAMEFLMFLMQPEEILRMTDANGAVPSRYSAIEQRDVYAPGGDLNVFIQQLGETAVPRPATAAYAVITTVFQEAVENIAQGADVKSELDRAVRRIDQDIQDNDGYR
jgi:multiple sugar transport system substrate-binding protein